MKEGKAGPIDKGRVPGVGDLMFWGGHVAIVVELKPSDDGDTFIVYANMGVSGADLTGVDRKGNYWLKVNQVAQRKGLAAGSFLGYWTP